MKRREKKEKSGRRRNFGGEKEGREMLGIKKVDHRSGRKLHKKLQVPNTISRLKRLYFT